MNPITKNLLGVSLLIMMCTHSLLAQVMNDCDATPLLPPFDFSENVLDEDEVGMSGLWTNPGGFQWTADGTASAFPAEWGEREAIKSVSENGALVIGGNNFGEPTSPELDFTEVAAESPVYLRFNQYFRQGDGSRTNVGVTIVDVVTSERTFFRLNDFIQDKVETGRRDEVLLDITSTATNNPIRIIFNYEGQGSFWIIDDVTFFDGRPCPPTRPERYGPEFTGLGYDYATDDSGWPYVPNEIVIQFSPDATPADKQALRDTLGAVLIDSCVCNKLELWRLGDSVLVDGNGNPYPGSGSIGIQERVQGASAQNKVQGVDFNYYTAAELQEGVRGPNSPLNSLDTLAIPLGAPDDIRIAILDTGVEITHPAVDQYIKRKPSNCYTDDPIGRNFVDDNNNPKDNHSHGTHVAGILATALENSGIECNFHLIPYKTHDAQGVSNLFDVTCATYQALEDEVSIINDSWGFYGEGSTVLRNAVDSAELQGVLIVSSAGNDGIGLDSLFQYPACYPTPNRITVAAYDTIDQILQLAPFSNRSDAWVDISAPGVDIRNAVPSWYNSSGWGLKSGTSMAAPVVSAAAAIAYCEQPDGYTYARDRILNCANQNTDLAVDIILGRVVSVDVTCLTPTDEISTPNEGLHIYPNPTRNGFTLQITTPLQQPVLRLYRADGQLLRTQALETTNPSAEIWINTSDFPSGMYWVELRDGQARWIEKLVKIE